MIWRARSNEQCVCPRGPCPRRCLLCGAWQRFRAVRSRVAACKRRLSSENCWPAPDTRRSTLNTKSHSTFAPPVLSGSALFIKRAKPMHCTVSTRHARIAHCVLTYRYVYVVAVNKRRDYLWTSVKSAFCSTDCQMDTHAHKHGTCGGKPG